ncbi:hypothetical protein [Sphingomonas sp.]|uniref:hypothetical protein n=1 Tax=Sphingomonas sp. TaxID=28214 RepID=UPI0025D9CBB0|nr:hypothetical protein [Sphingomonas sp.]
MNGTPKARGIPEVRETFRMIMKRHAGDFGRFLTKNMFGAVSTFIATLSIIVFGLVIVGWIDLPPGILAKGLHETVAGIGRIAHASIGELIRFTWPAVVLVIVALVLLTRRLDGGAMWLARRAQKVKVGEVELEFTPEAAKRLAQTTEEAFDSFREKADREFRRQVAALDIRQSLEMMLRNANALKDGKPISDIASVRCTLYVEDILFEDRLYQLTEYYPWDGKSSAGRTFSKRFGIVGRSWRTETHLAEGDVRTDRESLMCDWGMTREEASRLTRQRPSYLCSVLRAPAQDGTDSPDGLPVGLFFADCDSIGAFGDAKSATALAAAIAKAAFECGLRARLKVLREELNKYSAAIKS